MPFMPLSLQVIYLVAVYFFFFGFFPPPNINIYFSSEALPMRQTGTFHCLGSSELGLVPFYQQPLDITLALAN